MGVGAGEALAIRSELAIKNSSVALTLNLQGQVQAQDFQTTMLVVLNWRSVRTNNHVLLMKLQTKFYLGFFFNLIELCTMRN